MSLISIRYSGEVILVISTMVEVGSGDLDSERFRSTPRTLRALPVHPKPAVSWHSGFREGAHARRKTTPVHHAARRGSGRMAACRSWAVDDAANPSDDSEPAADRGGPREAYRPDVPKASVSIKRWVS